MCYAPEAVTMPRKVKMILAPLIFLLVLILVSELPTKEVKEKIAQQTSKTND
jgi:hypothetical protein